MDTEIGEKFKILFSNFKNALKESNYSSARILSNDLTKVSVFLDIPEYIFIAEFFEWLFYNLDDIELDTEISNRLNEQIISLVDEFENNIPPFENGFKQNLFDRLVKIRSDVTKIQIKHISKRKKVNISDLMRTK